MAYSDSPLLTRLIYRRAARQANLTQTDRASLEQILSGHVDVAGQSLDDMTPSGTAKIGDGTILQLLIANLPAIIAAIIQIINALPKPTTP